MATARRTGRPRQLGRAIGIDEYARRKGHRYNTSIVDLDKGRPIATFKGRQIIIPIQRVQMAFGVRKSWLDKNGGKFPTTRVMAQIWGYAGAKGRGVMPDFGPMLQGEMVPYDGGDGIETPTPIRLVELAEYLKRLQQK